VDDRQPVPHRRARALRVSAHPVLHEPELAAAAADVVLAGGSNSASSSPIHQLLHEASVSELALPLVRRRNGLVALADDRDGRLPDSRVEQLVEADPRPPRLVLPAWAQ
jgi:hypothetical protein